MIRQSAFAAILIMAIGIGASCGDDPTGLIVSDPWGRPTAPDADKGAFYVEINNSSGADDQLTGASSPVCDKTELHTTTMNDGIMSMTPATDELLRIRAGDSLVLEPGGLHVMCLGLTSPLAEGEPVELQLYFAVAEPLEIMVSVEQR